MFWQKVGMGVRITDLREPVQEIALKWRRRGVSMTDLISVGMLSLGNMTGDEIGAIIETWNKDIIVPQPAKEALGQNVTSGAAQIVADAEGQAEATEQKRKRGRQASKPA